MHLAIICLFTGCTIFAQNIEVQPIPQQVSKQDGQINLPETYQLLGETEANPYINIEERVLTSTEIEKCIRKNRANCVKMYKN